MKLKDVVAHIRNDYEKYYGDSLLRLDITILHTVAYPRDLFSPIRRRKFREKIEKRAKQAEQAANATEPTEGAEQGAVAVAEAPAVDDDEDEDAAVSPPPKPHAIYEMQSSIVCRGSLASDIRLRTPTIIAATPSRLFEKYVESCETDEARALMFPRELL